MLQMAASFAATMYLNRKYAGFLTIRKMKINFDEHESYALARLQLEGEDWYAHVRFDLTFYVRDSEPFMLIKSTHLLEETRPWVKGALQQLHGIEVKLPDMAKGLCKGVVEEVEE